MNSSNRRDQIKLLSGAIRNALECVENECDQLQTLTDGAVSTTGDLKNHRIKAENDKKRFQADLRQAYRALYSEYARTRKLLYSKAWFSNGLDEMDRAVQETALQSYHDQTHPFCSLEVRENVPSILMPVHSSVTIADTALLGRDETETQRALGVQDHTRESGRLWMAIAYVGVLGVFGSLTPANYCLSNS